MWIICTSPDEKSLDKFYMTIITVRIASHESIHLRKKKKKKMTDFYFMNIKCELLFLFCFVYVFLLRILFPPPTRCPGVTNRLQWNLMDRTVITTTSAYQIGIDKPD